WSWTPCPGTRPARSSRPRCRPSSEAGHAPNRRAGQRHHLAHALLAQRLEREAGPLDVLGGAARQVTVAGAHAPDGLDAALPPLALRVSLGVDVLQEDELAARAQ